MPRKKRYGGRPGGKLRAFARHRQQGFGLGPEQPLGLDISGA